MPCSVFDLLASALFADDLLPRKNSPNRLFSRHRRDTAGHGLRLQTLGANFWFPAKTTNVYALIRIYPLSVALHQDRRRNSNYSTSANFAVAIGTVLVPSTSTCCRSGILPS